MRLADFIFRNTEAIVDPWEGYAATLLPAAANMSSLALRDHAHPILEAVAKDISLPQTRVAQLDKSWGRAPHGPCPAETAAQTHAVLRAKSAFDINQLIGEYRALRASVLRLWLDNGKAGEFQVEDILRFNEAIDQALAESVDFFSKQVDLARNLFLGTLGHDLRSPLQTIQMTALYLQRLQAGEEVSKAASRMMNSSTRMKALLDDLFDFNRTNLGLLINITPKPVDLKKVITEELDELRAAHPERQLELEIVGDLKGVWDALRLQQLLSNLVTNAIKYGTPNTAVRIIAFADAAQVRIEVKNRGPVIEKSILNGLFDPLVRGMHQINEGAEDNSLGLGLYIAREIAKAHGGEIEARSDAIETVFTVRLPFATQASNIELNSIVNL